MSRPALAVVSPASTRSKVDLPLPLGPSSAVIMPRGKGPADSSRGTSRRP
ncbi:hypothetical protein MMZ06_07255 [Burkholderia gladioli]|nr:hypothetical protein [Burkholderia gladioli]MCH7269619.1 hypothetical protein [Burkholderia gladioli]MDZ4036925.1 hypothetical protein [Burkholderia gladioli pv. alliicola]MEB2546440.1 hypothetical protein [Burkholderia gladioli]